MIDRTSIVYVTWGESALRPGLGRPLTRWERIRVTVKRPYWRAKYLIEDLSEVSADRIRGAWRVLLGRSDWS